MFAMQLEGGAPICEQLCEHIARFIFNGTLAENEKLPAVREVAKSLGINPNTVQKAYAQLEQRGLIYSIPAKGSYVARREATSKIIRGELLLKVEKTLGEAISAGIEKEELIRLIEKLEGGNGYD